MAPLSPSQTLLPWCSLIRNRKVLPALVFLSLRTGDAVTVRTVGQFFPSACQQRASLRGWMVEQNGVSEGAHVVSAIDPWQVNKEEETDENETEWLMEEIQLPSPRQGKEGQENGHITTKSVKALSSLHGDDQDSEDEVLTIPEVKVHSGRGAGAESSHPLRNPQSSALQEREDDRAGLVRGEKARKGKFRSAQQKTVSSTKLVSFHDDSDEDLLHI